MGQGLRRFSLTEYDYTDPLPHSTPLSPSDWEREEFHSPHFKPFTLLHGWIKEGATVASETSLLLGTQK